MPKLTKTVIEAAEHHQEDAYCIWDSQVSGFGVKVHAIGKKTDPTKFRKTFVLKYRSGEGGRAAKQRWYKIGLVGSLHLEDARQKAMTLIAQIGAGGDPQRQREDLRESMSMRDLWERFEEDHLCQDDPKQRRVKQNTAEDYKAMWTNHIDPEFGTSKIRDVSRKDVIALHQRIGKKAPYTANRMVAMLSKIFNMADKWELIPPGSNPCRHVPRYKERSRTRFLSEKELKALRVSLRQGLALQEENHYMVGAILLLLFTGARVSEILGTEWQWIDLEKRVIALPDSKTGAKVLFLSEPAIAVINFLKSLPHSVDQKYMIRGRLDGRPFDNLRKVWRRVCKRADIKGARLHDLRHTAASIGVNNGLGLPIIGRLLGHTQVSTTQRYSHVDTNPALAAANLIGTVIAANVGASILLDSVPDPAKSE